MPFNCKTPFPWRICCGKLTGQPWLFLRRHPGFLPELCHPDSAGSVSLIATCWCQARRLSPASVQGVLNPSTSVMQISATPGRHHSFAVSVSIHTVMHIIFKQTHFLILEWMSLKGKLCISSLEMKSQHHLPWIQDIRKRAARRSFKLRAGRRCFAQRWLFFLLKSKIIEVRKRTWVVKRVPSTIKKKKVRLLGVKRPMSLKKKKRPMSTKWDFVLDLRKAIEREIE